MPTGETTLFISFSRMIVSAFGGFCFILFGFSIMSWKWMAKNWNKFKEDVHYLVEI